MLSNIHLFSWQTRCTVLYIIGYASLAFIISGLGPLIPFKADESGRAETDYSIVFTFRGIGYLAGSILVGRIEHRFNSHLLLTSYFFVLGTSAYLGVVVRSIPMLAVVFLFNGIGCSGIDVLSQALTVEVHEEGVQPWMQFLHFCYGIGAFTSPIIMSGLGQEAFKYFGLICLIVGCVCIFIDPPRIHKASDNSIVINPEEEEAEGSKRITSDINFFLCIMFFFYLGAEVGFGGWISTYATITGASTKEEAAFCSGVFWVFITLGRMLAIPAATRFSTNSQIQLLIYSCVLSVSTALVFVGLGLTRMAVYLGSAWFGLSMSAIYPLLMSLPTELKFKTTAEDTSRYVISGAIGESTIPVVFGLMMAALGSNMLFTLALIISVIFLGLHKKVLEYSYAVKNKPDLEMELFNRV